MAISKIILNGVTQMDLTDTTAEAENVTAPEIFYSSNGTRTIGTGTGNLPETTKIALLNCF